MEEILGSIVVDPFVFYAVLIGIIVVLAIILMFILRSRYNVPKSKSKSKSYHKIDPIVLEDNVDIMNINSKATEQVEQVVKEEVKPQSEIKDLLSIMEQDLQKEVPKISDYEDDQEEKAIISYQQLLATKHKLESEMTSDETPLPTVSKVTIDKAFEFDIEEEEKPVPIIETEVDNKKFKNSEFISPIFGRDSIDEYYSSRHGKAAKETQVKEIVKPKTVSEPAARGDDFLLSLKEFRRNLD